MLSYFAENGTVPFRFRRSDYQFPTWFQPIYAEFLVYRKYQGIVDRTIHKQHSVITSTHIRYTEPWAEIFISYIQYKRGLGLQYDRPEYELMALLRFLIERSGNRLEITQETAEAWCQRRDGKSANTWSFRTAIYRQLAIYLNSRGIPAYIPLSPRMRTVKYVPYIFTESEILRIYNEADKLELSRQSSYNKIIPEVLRILFSTGLRISQAVNLKVTDVDLAAGVLCVLESKNLKSWLVPMDMSLTKRLQQYGYRI